MSVLRHSLSAPALGAMAFESNADTSVKQRAPRDRPARDLTPRSRARSHASYFIIIPSIFIFPTITVDGAARAPASNPLRRVVSEAATSFRVSDATM